MLKSLLTFFCLVTISATVIAVTAEKTSKKPPVLSDSRVEIKTIASQMASGFLAAESALSPVELVIAERVFQGRMSCELGAFVTLTADVKSPGYFDLYIKNQKFRMFPVETSTGAIRLEDPKAGAVWLQLSNKSMLMSQKLGQRLADACVNPDQALIAEMMIKNPPPSLLDAPSIVTTK